MSNMYYIKRLREFLMFLRDENVFVENFGGVVTVYKNGNPVRNILPPWKFTFKGRGIVSSDLSIKNLTILNYIEENHENDYIVILPKNHNQCSILVFDGIQCIYEANIKFFTKIKRVFL